MGLGLGLSYGYGLGNGYEFREFAQVGMGLGGPYGATCHLMLEIWMEISDWVVLQPILELKGQCANIIFLRANMGYQLVLQGAKCNLPKLKSFCTYVVQCHLFLFLLNFVMKIEEREIEKKQKNTNIRGSAHCVYVHTQNLKGLHLSCFLG